MVNSKYVNGSLMLCTVLEERDLHRFRIFFETIPFCHAFTNYTCHLKTEKYRTNSIYCKIFIYIHKNLFAPQAQDLLEKLAEILLCNFWLKHILLKLKTKKLLRIISSKNNSWSFLMFKILEHLLYMKIYHQ